MPEEALLKIEKVSKHFGGIYAVNNVSLDIHEGGIWSMVGPNGSGKSTLFNTILGLYKPDEGTISFKGERINNMYPYQIYARGLVNSFQTPRIFHSMTILDNMLVAARGHQGDSMWNSLFMRKKWQKQEEKLIDEALNLLEFVELNRMAFSPAAELSGGQRKLLELAKVLMAKPTLLLLDEPAAGINPVLAKKIFRKLNEISRNGTTFLIIEHRLDLLFEFASWTYVLNKGSIIATGKPKDIVNNPVFYQAYLGEE
ncbi:MAG: ABC transporter ATP-binding protein [Dehalococcoidia bacterium]|nr:ABC transporter ATP-binding protein [Dehalococcoidia bacterium]